MASIESGMFGYLRYSSKILTFRSVILTKLASSNPVASPRSRLHVASKNDADICSNRTRLWKASSTSTTT
jgi:hypothetical protein